MMNSEAEIDIDITNLNYGFFVEGGGVMLSVHVYSISPSSIQGL